MQILPLGLGPRVAQLAIVSAADTSFFPLLKDLVASVRDTPEGRATPIFVLDAGLGTGDKAWLAERQIKVVVPPWPYAIDAPGPQRVLAMRCQIPALLPGHAIYLWLDADVWIQDGSAIELYRKSAEQNQFCITAEVDRSYNPGEVMRWAGWASTRLYPALAPRLAGMPLLNAGVFAARADAPHWQAWRRRIEEAMSVAGADFFLDQTALNVIAYVDGLDMAVLPSRYNWICYRALPHATDDGKTLLDPQPPHQPLGVIHMTDETKRRHFVLRTIGGGMITRSLRYSARPSASVDPANPAARQINLALEDSMNHWHRRASQQLRRIVADHPRDAAAHVSLGQVAARDGDYGEAARAFWRAAALDPGNSAIHAQLGAIYLRQGRCEEAAAALRRALELSPGDPEIERQLAKSIDDEAMPTGDYVSPGLMRARIDTHFPNMIRGNPAAHPWPYLRRGSPHNWYVDKRAPTIGFVSRDEAHILFNTALRFEGKPALEIGCFMGFSTCHLLLGGVRLQVVDPLLRDRGVITSVANSLTSAGVMDACQLIPASSPAAVEQLVARDGRCWSLAFIDGDHEGDAPRRDAEVCERFLAPDALVLFHDLLSPDVAAGLAYFRERGWNTRIYLTGQIMGVAWRGSVAPIEHIPDPALPRDLPPHLAPWRKDLQ